MAAVVNKEECNGCKSCVDVCPSTAIDMVDDKAEVRADDCIDCNACEDACQSGAIKVQS